MSDQYPRPGQPGQEPPTQVAGGQQQPGYGQQPGYPPQGYAQPQPYGAPPGGGYPPGPGGPGYPTGPGGGKKRTGLVVGVLLAVVALVAGAVVVVGLVTDWYGLADDEPRKKRTVTATVTASPTEGGEDPTDDPTDEITDEITDVTTESTDEITDVALPTEDPTIIARAYLDSLVEGDCPALEGLSTPEWFSSAYTDQEGCREKAGTAQMSAAQYDFKEPVESDQGRGVTVTADISAPDGSEFLGTWALVADDDSWLVEFFILT